MVFGGKFLTNLIGFGEHNRRYEAGLNPWREDRKYYEDYRNHGGYNPYTDPYDRPRPQYWPNQGLGRGNGGRRHGSGGHHGDGFGMGRDVGGRRGSPGEGLPEGPILPGPGYRKPRRGEKEDRLHLDPDDPEGSPFYKNNPELFERGRAAGLLPQRNGRGGARNRHGGSGRQVFPRVRGGDGRRSHSMDGGRNPFAEGLGRGRSRDHPMSGGSGGRYGAGGGRMKGAPSLAPGVSY